MALPRANRLKHRLEFQSVYQSGFRRTGDCFIVRGLPQQDDRKERPTQVGISISQKVSKRAVIRNRIKRQIRAIFRQLLPRISPGWQLVVVVRPAATRCEYDEFLRELEQLLAQAEVLHGN